MGPWAGLSLLQLPCAGLGGPFVFVLSHSVGTRLVLHNIN